MTYKNNYEALESFVQRCYEARLAKGWSQVDVSLEADLNRNTYPKLEADCKRSNPRYQTLEKIANALDINLREFFG